MRNVKALLASLLVLTLLLGTVFALPVTAEDVNAEANAEDETAEVEVVEETLPDDAMYAAGTQAFGEGVEVNAGEKEEPAAVGETQAQTEPSTQEPAPQVGPVTGLKATSNKTNRISLAWIGVSEVAGYRVYARNTDTADSVLKLIATTAETNITVMNLNPGHVYQFKVVAYKTLDGQIYEGSASQLSTPTAPKNVSNFRLKSSDNSIVLAYSKVGSCDGYVVYRQSSESGGKAVKYKTLSKSTTQFTDSKVKANSPYYYRIYAYRKAGSKTVLSEKYAEVKTVAGLAAPKDDKSTTRLNRILLSWNYSRYAKGYDIYYSTNNKTFKKLATTTDNFYYSGKLKTGKIYYMRVYPFRYVGKSQQKIRGAYFGKKFKINNEAYGQNPGKNYIEVSIRLQHMWMFVNGEQYVSTPIVTGNANSMDTPRGFWHIQNKASPCTLSGAGYTSYVRYWMAFIGGSHGIHDASWRSSFGGQIYRGNGSHGCINTPYNNVKKMYQKAYVGEPVVVYY